MIDNYDEREPYGDYGYSGSAASAVSDAVNNLSGVAKIKVIGVGGAGNNAVDRLIESGLKSAEYIVVNTDNQALARSKAANRIQIGVKLTKGLGAGADPNVGKAAAEENKEAIAEVLKDTDLLFITAGMGGGTGTGAAPVIAKIAKDMKILTVAVVTLPFNFEAKRRMDNAMSGIEELRKSVDSIITIPNDKIRQVVPKGTSFSDSLKVADEVLRQGIRGIAELIVKPSLINLDFADVKATLKGRGLAHMGIGVAKGEKRISDAVRCAVCSPLLNTTIEGASSVILNIIGGKDLSLDEVVMAADLVKGVIDYSANVIFGACIDENMSDEVEVVIIATGFTNAQNGITPESQDSALRQASLLSQKIDLAYNANERANVREETAPVYNAPRYPDNGGMRYAQPMPAYGYPAQQPQNVPPMQGGMQNGYAPAYPQPAQPMQPMQNMPPVQPMGNGNISFEPDDPIPGPTDERSTDNTDRKHRPRFVDYFMRKNSDDK
ncbi:MAG: cell division protein FtsZ [Clostridia bacterium]|nr:cell division protein FtsZ [Clostridia bacterium]